MEKTAVRIVRVDSDGINFLTVPDCRVDYLPSKKYKVEKPNAFDPTIIHRRFPYFEDTVEVTFILGPTDYSDLFFFLTAPGIFYIEFTWKTNITRQLRVICEELPTLPDDLREYTGEANAVFVSRYTTHPGSIDWGTYTIPDGDEEMFT